MKKEKKELLNKLIKLREKQLELFKKNIIEQIKNSIKVIKEAKQGRINLTYAININELCSQYLIEFVKGGKLCKKK